MAPNNSKKHQTMTTITSKSGSWVDGSGFPYPVDYNDHFETPAEAYRDLRPVLDWLTTTISIPVGKTLYDPYYCNGRAKRLLHEIGYDQVVHEKRDFYADVKNGTVPAYDIFITNPPYSDEHKSKCIEYCCTTMQQQTQQTKQTQQQNYKPFFLLMPAYVATKQYMRSALPDLFFLIPSVEYQYIHPDDTGKDISPFSSLWYCGVGAARVDACVQHLLTLSSSSLSSSSSWRLAKSLPELADLKMIRLQNRLNPRQRRKQRQPQPAQQLLGSSTETPAAVVETTEPVCTTSNNDPSLTRRKNKAGGVDNGGSSNSSSSGNNKNKKNTTTTSKYRDSTSGQRKRQRF
jgi:hypothetical protein